MKKDILYEALILLQARFCVGFISMYCIRHKKFNISHIILLSENGILCTTTTYYVQCTYHLLSELKYFKRQDTNNVSLHINISVLKQPYDFLLVFLLLCRFTLIPLKCILLNTHFKMLLR